MADLLAQGLRAACKATGTEIKQQISAADANSGSRFIEHSPHCFSLQIGATLGAKVMNSIHIALAVFLTTVTCLAQGQVNFANRVGAGGSILNAPVLLLGTPSGPGPNYSVQLLLIANNSLTPLTPVSTFNPPGTGAGAISSQFWAPKTVDVPGVFGGQQATFLVRAWLTDFGSYGGAIAAGYGYGASDPFTVTVGGAGSDPTVPPATPANLTTLKSFNVGNPPEPSTITIGLLGAAVLVVFKRRR